MSEYMTFVGIDVSRDRLDVFVLPQQQAFALSNDASGVAQLCHRLQELGEHTLVVMEATNTFWKLSATQLGSAGLKVAVINPRQVRDLPGPPAGWPRPMLSMHRCLRCLPRRCVRRCAACPMSTVSLPANCWPVEPS